MEPSRYDPLITHDPSGTVHLSFTDELDRKMLCLLVTTHLLAIAQNGEGNRASTLMQRRNNGPEENIAVIVNKRCGKGMCPDGTRNKNESEVLVLKRRRSDRWAITQRWAALYGGNNGPKRRAADRRTPEGLYYVVYINDKGQHPRFGGWSLGLDYPNPEDIADKLTGGLIAFHGGPPTTTFGCIRLLDASPSYKRVNRHSRRYKTDNTVAIAALKRLVRRQYNSKKKLVPTFIVPSLSEDCRGSPTHPYLIEDVCGDQLNELIHHATTQFGASAKAQLDRPRRLEVERALGCPRCELRLIGQWFKASEVSASSFQPHGCGHQEPLFPCPPVNLLDSRPPTPWCEGVQGLGEGQQLRFSFRRRRTVSHIKIHNGYQETPESFKAHGRAALVRVSNGHSHRDLIIDSIHYGPQIQELHPPLEGKRFSLTILKAVPGKMFAETCMSEIAFGYRASSVKIREIVRPESSGQQTVVAVHPEFVEASSTLHGCSNPLTSTGELEDCRASWVKDGLQETAWCEGEKGLGEGTYLTLRFSKEQRIAGIRMASGHRRDELSYHYNGRVTRLTIRVGDQMLDADMPPSFYKFVRANFPQVVRAKAIHLQITGAEKGLYTRDTCISEIQVLLAQ